MAMSTINTAIADTLVINGSITANIIVNHWVVTISTISIRRNKISEQVLPQAT